MRRVFVPADQPEVWPTGKETYLPIEIDQLEELLRGRSTRRRQPASLLLDARWSAGVLVGRGELRIDEASWVPWPVSAMQITDPSWEYGDGAALGWWSSADVAGRGVHGLAAVRPGVLTFGFRAPASSMAFAPYEFVLEAPAALQRTIEVSAPGWLRFSGPGLIVEPLGVAAEQATWLRWRLKAKPGVKIIVNAEDIRPTTGAAIEELTLAERTRLVIRSDAVEVVSRLELKSKTPLPATLRVATPAGLILESANLDGKPLEFSAARRVASQEEVAGVSVMEIGLPVGGRPSGGVLTLRGVAPFPFDEDFRAPRPRLLNAKWAEGVITVAPSSGIQIADAYAGDGSTLASVAGSTGRLPSMLAYRLLGPQGQLWLRVTPEPSRIDASLSRSLRLGSEADQATLRIDLHGLSGPPPTALSFDLTPGWRIESVEAQPTTCLDRWATVTENRQKSLRILLSDGLAAFEGGSFTVRAQRNASTRPGKSYSLQELQVLQPNVFSPRQDWWEISAPGFRSLTPVSVPERRKKPVGLIADQPAAAGAQDDADGLIISSVGGKRGSVRVDQPSQSIHAGEGVVKLDMAGADPDEFADWGVRIDDRRAPLEPKLLVSATHTDEGIAYRLSVDFGRRGVPQEPVVVWFDTPLPETTSWTAQPSGRPLAVTPSHGGRRWRISNASTGGVSGFLAETLLRTEGLNALPVDPKPAQSRLARDNAAGDSPTRSSTKPINFKTIPLALISGSTNRSADVSIGPRLSELGWINFPGGTPREPVPGVEPGAFSWTYDPSRVHAAGPNDDRQIGPASALRWSPRAEEREFDCVLQRLTSRYNANGGARHTAEYLRGIPRANARFRLPSGAELIDVTTGAGRLLTTKVSPSGVVLVEFKEAAIRQTVKVRYTTRTTPLRHNETLTPIVLESPLPPAVFSWRVELPGGYRLAPLGESTFGLLSRLIGLSDSGAKLSSSRQTGGIGDDQSHHERVISADSTQGVRIENPATRLRWLIAAAVSAAVLGAGVFRSRRRLWCVTCLLALAAVLIAPVDSADTAEALWVGWLFGVPVAIVARRFAMACRNPRPLVRARPSGPGGSTTVTQPTVMLLLVFIASTQGAAFADPLPGLSDQVPEAVLLPIDKQGAAAGNKAYIREAWLQQLLAASERSQRSEPGDALLRSLECRAVFERSADGGLEPGRWALRLELSVLARATRVSLPLRKADADWPARVLIDGQPVPLRWSSSGVGCTFEVEEPGEVRAELRFVPATQASDGESFVRLGLVPSGNGSLSIDFPADQGDLRTPFLRSRVSRGDLRGNMRASLAGKDELLVCWTDEPREALLSKTEIDVMQWLRVTPRGVYLLVQGKAVDTEGVSSVWDFVPPPGCQQVSLVAGTLRPSSSDAPTRRSAAYRLSRSSVEGRVRLPVVGVVGGSVRSRSLALSIDDQYDWSLETAGDTRALDADEFIQRWQPEEVAPEVDGAVVINSGPGPVLAVALKQVDTLLAQRLLVTTRSDGADYAYVADYAESNTQPIGQRAYRVPTGLRVRNVRIEPAGNEIASRWSRPRPDKLVVFGDSDGLRGRAYRVVIEGALPDPTDGERDVARVADRSSRQPLAVTLAAVDSLVATPLGEAWRPISSGGSRPGEAAPIATAVLEPDAPSPRYRWEPNNPEARIVSLTTFDRAQAGSVDVDWSLTGEVTRGQLRRLPILVAPGVVLGEVIEPAGAFVDRDNSVTGVERWLVLPERIRAGEAFAARLSATLPDDSGLSFTATPLSFSKPFGSDRLIAIRTADRDRKTQGGWRWSGLRPVEAPPGRREPETGKAALRFLKPVGRGIEPRLSWSVAAEATLVEPVVDTAIHRSVLAPGGGAVTSSVLVVSPNGAACFRLKLPESGRLLSASVDGEWAPWRRVGPGEWEVLLQDRRRTCVMRLTVDSPTGLGSLVTPAPISPDGERRQPMTTLYDVAAPRGLAVRVSADVEPLSAEQLSAARRTAETSNGLAPEALDPAPAEPPGLSAAVERYRFIASGSHEPPRLESTSQYVAVRYALAALIGGLTIAGVVRGAGVGGKVSRA